MVGDAIVWYRDVSMAVGRRWQLAYKENTKHIVQAHKLEIWYRNFGSVASYNTHGLLSAMTVGV